MAQYWYKADKRIKRISEQDDDRDVIQQVADLKENGYVRINDRHNPNDLYDKSPKVKKKSKAKSKAKKK